MSTTITRLPGSKWWIETDDAIFEIIGTYNKTQINADVQAIKATLLTYPDATQDANDVVRITNALGTQGWTTDKLARITSLVNSMYQSYQGDARQLEAAQLQSRLDALIALRNRLV